MDLSGKNKTIGTSINAFTTRKLTESPINKAAARGFFDSNKPAAKSSPNVGARELIRDSSVVKGAEIIIKKINAGNNKSNKL